MLRTTYDLAPLGEEFLRRPSIEAIVMRMTTQPPPLSTPTSASRLLAAAPPPPSVVVEPAVEQGQPSASSPVAIQSPKVASPLMIT